MTTHLKRRELLTVARSIAIHYKKAGLSLTLRQLYYQCVARGIIPNSQKSYKRLGDTIGNARLKGQFHLDLIVDRGRRAEPSQHMRCKVDVHVGEDEAAEMLKTVPHLAIGVDRWFNQPAYVSVWVEKEALVGVFERPCDELGVGLFACKGYPSHSALWQWLQGYRDAARFDPHTKICNDLNERLPRTGPRRAVVLYFGDHDPDGWQIPRSAEETLHTLQLLTLLHDLPIRFERVALNMDQIEEYDPPPFPAKPSSSRYARYIDEHMTDEAWELDALRPDVLDKLIRDKVEELWDQAIYDKMQAFAEANRKRLIQRIIQPGWAKGVLT